MIKKRLIPVLLLKNGWLVQSKGFVNFQNLGNPTTAVKRLSEWAADELIYLDISDSDIYNIRRDDQGYPNRKTFLEIISDVSKYAFMPITVGEKIRKLEKINKFLKNGADKISINKISRINPKFVTEAAKEFSVDYIIRVGGDDPLIDPNACLSVLREHKKEEAYDFIYTSHRQGWPYGCACELISVNTLREIMKKTNNPLHNHLIQQ